MPLHRKIGGILFDWYPSVCLSAENLTCELNHNFHTVQVTVLIFGMHVDFDNTQLVRVILLRTRRN